MIRKLVLTAQNSVASAARFWRVTDNNGTSRMPARCSRDAKLLSNQTSATYANEREMRSFDSVKRTHCRNMYRACFPCGNLGAAL